MPARSHRPLLAGVALAALPLLALAPVAPADAATTLRAALPPGKINHIFVIDLENEGFATTFGPGSPATYLNGVLRKKGELVTHYYGTGHDSLDNYIAQVSGQAPTKDTQADCADHDFAFVDVQPGNPAPSSATSPGQVVGDGCVYPGIVATIGDQLDHKYPPNPSTHVAAWRGYNQDMGNDPSRDGGVADSLGGTDCAHPLPGRTDTAEVATATDQYTTRHNPFVWFRSITNDPAVCDANVVPLGTLLSNGRPDPRGHLAHDLARAATTPHFAFVTPNLCNDGHDGTCAGPNSAGGPTGGLVGADLFLQHWMPLLFNSPAYREGDTLVVITFDEADVDPSANPAYGAACCNEQPGPNTASPGNAGATTDQYPGGGQVGALLLNPRYLVAGSTDTTGSYNHYSALRSYEDLLGLTTGGSDGHGHLGLAGAAGLRPFGKDVFNRAG